MKTLHFHWITTATALLATLGATLVTLLPAAARAEPAARQDKSLVERGRYLVQIAGCNDCHTPGYMEAAGKVDEKLWLTGDSFGWRGPWGTTYATNLRLNAQSMSQQQWLKHVATMQPRPPMPFFNVQAMTEHDRKAIYAYLKAMGPAGKPAPAWVPPGKEPPQPYALFPG
jgi:mono/diheme cytochrome c family protein